MSKTDHPRRKKTARQRAEETLGIAERRVTKLQKQHQHAEAAARAIADELDEAQTRLAYARQDPALAEGSTTTRTPKAGATT